MKNCLRKKVTRGSSPWETIVRDELGGGSDKSICYKDIHLSSFYRKNT